MSTATVPQQIQRQQRGRYLATLQLAHSSSRRWLSETPSRSVHLHATHSASCHSRHVLSFSPGPPKRTCRLTCRRKQRAGLCQDRLDSSR